MDYIRVSGTAKAGRCISAVFLSLDCKECKTRILAAEKSQWWIVSLVKKKKKVQRKIVLKTADVD